MMIPLVHLGTGAPRMVRFDDIIYVTVHGKDVTIHTLQGEYRSLSTFEEFIDLLKPWGFEQIERSNLLKLSSIQRFDRKKSEVIIIGPGGTEVKLSVSRRNRAKLKRH